MLKLKAAYPKWTSVLHAPAGAVEEVVRSAGLADIKMARVRTILQQLIDEDHCTAKGEPSLEFLNDHPTEFCKEYLGNFNGIGPKTVSCVLLFAMARQDFPVDTHVHKLALAMRWVPATATREGTYDILNRSVPGDIKYALHVLFVHHGKVLKNKLGVLSAVGRGKLMFEEHSDSPGKVKSEMKSEVKSEHNLTSPEAGPATKMNIGTASKVKGEVKLEVDHPPVQAERRIKSEAVELCEVKQEMAVTVKTEPSCESLYEQHYA